MLMRYTIKISAVKTDLPIELQHLRVAAYCRVSTEWDEQATSIELQERHYIQLISENPNWENAGIFSEKATGLILKERPVFCEMISKCQKRKIDLSLTKSISRFGRNTLEVLRILQSLCGLGVEVYFEREDMRLNEQQIQVLSPSRKNGHETWRKSGMIQIRRLSGGSTKPILKACGREPA